MNKPPLPLDIETVDRWLAAAHISVAAAEVQGLLCGLLCALGGDVRERWLGELFNAEATGIETLPAPQDMLGRLYTQTAAGLEDPELGFSPLLPDDAQPLSQRAQAVNDWCQGFLYGLGVAGGKAQRVLSDEGKEMLRDFSEITRMDAASVEASEENEQALTEVIEFIRVAVMLVYAELAARRESVS